jgi:hypothetical protein
MNNYRGEENEILMKCLYKMRIKMLKTEIKNKKELVEEKVPIVHY